MPVRFMVPPPPNGYERIGWVPSAEFRAELAERGLEVDTWEQDDGTLVIDVREKAEVSKPFDPVEAFERVMGEERPEIEGVPEMPCGWCGVPINRATGDGERPPVVGDYSVCLLCAGINRFGPRLELVAMTPAEVAAVPAEERRQLGEMVAMVRGMWLGGGRKPAC